MPDDRMTEEVLSGVVKCPRCKGKGTILDSFHIWTALPTLGVSLTFRDPCPRCRGECVIRV